MRDGDTVIAAHKGVTMPGLSPRQHRAMTPGRFADLGTEKWPLFAAGRDALVLVLVAVTMLVLAHRFALFEYLVAWGHRWAVADVPDLIVTVLVLAFALKVYAWRRWRETRRALALLRGERDFADALVGTVGALLLALDRQGRIVAFNRACEALTGYAAAEVTGRPFWELFLLPEERSARCCRLRRSRRRALPERPREPVGRARRRSATSDRLGQHRSPRQHRRGRICRRHRPRHHRAPGRRRRRSRASEARYRALFDAAPIGIALADPDRRLLACNPAYARLVGHDESRPARTLHSPIVTHPEDAAPDLALYRELIDGRRAWGMRSTSATSARTGATVWGRLTVALVRDAAGAPLCAVGMVEDRTAQRAAADDLRRLGSQLSPQEWRVLPLLAEGLTYDAIGAQLHISGETVKTHVRRIGEKLGCGQRRQDVLAAARAGGLLDLLPFTPPKSVGTDNQSRP